MEDIYEAIFDILCCIVVADGTATSAEKQKVIEVMKKTGAPWRSSQLAEKLATFMTRARIDGIENVVEKSFAHVPKFKEIGREKVLLQCVDLIADADGKLDERETKLIADIRERLEG